MVPTTAESSPTSTGTRVHVAARRPGPWVGYFDQIATDSAADIDIRFINGPIQRFDIDVVHALNADVEHLIGSAKSSPLKRAAKAWSLVAQMRRHRVALVQTVVCPPPERPSLARRILDRATATWILPEPGPTPPKPRRTTVIPLAHHRERYLGYPRGESEPGRVLCVVSADSSPMVRQLIGIPRVARTPNISLRIVGEATSSLEDAVLRASQGPSGRVTAQLGRVSDGAVLQEIDRAELLVQPSVAGYRDFQTVLLALSHDTPALVPDTEAMRHLATEAGPGWIHLAPGPMTAATVDRTIQTVRTTPPPERAHLAARDQDVIGRAHASLYRSPRGSVR